MQHEENINDGRDQVLLADVITSSVNKFKVLSAKCSWTDVINQKYSVNGSAFYIYFLKKFYLYKRYKLILYFTNNKFDANSTLLLIGLDGRGHF